jgi:potassium voltage-gated channel Eag-related subfamily H protein 7
MFAINFVVNILFIVDMCMNFFLAFQDEKKGELVTDRRRIVKAYLFGWFPIDFISVVPFDIANVVGDNEAVADLKILKVVRLLRLIKLLRIMRASRVIKRLENQIGLSIRAMSQLKLLTRNIFLVHWVRHNPVVIPIDLLSSHFFFT